jgi:hypothetical protein
MFIIMILSGLLSTMSVWADSYEDIRYSLNDLYMIFLMTGWMFLFMGFYYRDFIPFIIGSVLVVVNLWCIRTQFMITEEQYVLGMIPHHSMAIHMSKALLLKQTGLNEFATSIIETQRKEIDFMKTGR